VLSGLGLSVAGRRLALAGAIVAVALAGAAPSYALPGAGSSPIDDAVQSLRSSPIYVDSRAEEHLSPADIERVKDRIAGAHAGPMYIAVLPASAAQAAGGDPTATLRLVARELVRRGVYVGVIGTSFRAGATPGQLPARTVPKLATEAFTAHRSEGVTAVLLDFIDRVGAARSGGTAGGGGTAGNTGSTGGGNSGGPKAWWIVLLIAGAVGGVLGLVLHRRRRRELEEVKRVARDDLVALGDDIRALDVDVAMPNASQDAKDHYNQAVEIYEKAEQAFDRARRPEDLRPVSGELARGRFEMQVAAALLEGKPAPERRAPCFFDPRHGPSVRMVAWAPDGGVPRPVPACAADADRVERGLDPEVREIDAAGRRVPYWSAPPAYSPWFGGYYGDFGGGGFLPGLLVGEMLSGAQASSDASADPSGGGDSGGGGNLGGADDWGGGGDFGGGDSGDGGDFGGGDSGGGDFGGGDGGGGGDF
jgi:hypothetical protein